MNELICKYNDIKNRNLKLDMSRGKPSPEQLDAVEDLLSIVGKNSDCYSESGTDCRNYGNPDGIPEAKKVFEILLGLPQKNIFIFGNSSLNVMYDTISNAWCFGICGGDPWGKQGKIKFLCPVPGYDRHFAITELFGIEMINIPINKTGPDMDMIENLVSSDPAIKGMWCVPKYSNPTGVTFSEDTVKRLARLKPLANDFRIFWDNAYCIHDLSEEPDVLLNIYDEACKYENGDIAYIFASTSKITYAGAGISCLAASDKNLNDISEKLKIRTIGHDKLNMLRHAKYLSDNDRIKTVMDRHKNIIKPKFDLCIEYFEKELSGIENVSWTKPNGGYFINLNLPDFTARKTVELAAEAGLVLTPAGASYPYGKDPRDNSIRIAPTYPSIGELENALELLCICVKIAIGKK